MGEQYEYAEGWSPRFFFLVYLHILYTSHFTPAPDNMKRAKCLSLRRVEILGESTHWGLRKEVRANIYAKSHGREWHLNIFVAPGVSSLSTQQKVPPSMGSAFKKQTRSFIANLCHIRGPLNKKVEHILAGMVAKVAWWRQISLGE